MRGEKGCELLGGKEVNVLRIAICEDNPQHAEILKAMIEKWASEENKRADIGNYKSAEEFMFHWPGDAHYDLAFLDIRLASVTGLQLARYIRQQDRSMLLVFTTGLKDYVLKGYEVRAYRYLIKPLKEKDIAATLNKAEAELEASRSDAIAIPICNVTRRIFKTDIYYVEIDDHYVVLHTVQGNLRYKQKLSEIEHFFPEPQFCKCHRSYIVNLYHTGKLTKNEVQIDNGDTLPVSRTRWAAFNECFITYYMTKNNQW